MKKKAVAKKVRGLSLKELFIRQELEELDMKYDEDLNRFGDSTRYRLSIEAKYQEDKNKILLKCPGLSVCEVY